MSARLTWGNDVKRYLLERSQIRSDVPDGCWRYQCRTMTSVWHLRELAALQSEKCLAECNREHQRE